MASMNTTTPPLAAQPTTPAPRQPGLDALTRALHWTLALSFAGAYLTAEADAWMPVHQLLGYTAIALALLRGLWGFVGPRERRWSAMGKRLAQAPKLLQNWRSGGATLMPVYHLTQTTLAMSLLLLALLAGLSGAGLVLSPWGEALEDLHEGLSELMLVTVLVHLGLMLLMTLLRQRNLARPMLSAGLKRASGLNRVLAALLVATVLAVWAWQWQQPAAFLTQGEHGEQHSGDHRDVDDD